MGSIPPIKFYLHDFLNAVPLIYPVLEKKIATPLQLCLSCPSDIAKVAGGKSGFAGVVPSVVAIDRPDFHIIDSFCISSKGKVKTVCFYSRVPLEEVGSVILDSRSRTSHLMLKVLFKLKGIKFPSFREEVISGKTIDQLNGEGMLIIGDDNVFLEKELSGFYKYDLGELWFALTGKKFVHAISVTTNPKEVVFLRQILRECVEYSFKNFEEMVEYASKKYLISEAFCAEYLRGIILYPFDHEAEDGLEKFLRFSRELEMPA